MRYLGSRRPRARTLVAAGALLLFATFASAATMALANDIEYCTFASVAGLQLNGNAAQAGATLRLTRNVAQQDSSAFRTSTLALTATTDFHTHFQFVLTPGGNGQADGVTFVVQADPRGATALGGNGGGIGYGTSNGGTRIQPAVEVEFDTYANTWDPNANHVGVMRNGDETTHLAVGTPAFALAGAAPVDAWIDYASATTTLSVFVSSTTTKPAAPLVTATVDVFTTVGAAATFGFTGSTGGQSELQVLGMWILSLGGFSECTCTTDAQCAVPTLRCETPPGVCVQCLTNADCSGTTPVCDPAAHTCGPCTSDSQCGGSTPHCAPAGDPLAGACVACVTDAECDGSPDTKTPICAKVGISPITDTCQACGSNAQCALASVAPVCVSGGSHAGQCASCATNTDCSGATPLCLDTGATDQCVQCTTNLNCSGATPICDATTHACRPCGSDGECAGPTPACETSGPLQGECTQCSASNASSCTGPDPACNTVTGTCVACDVDTDCAANTPLCIAHACAGCTSDYTPSSPPAGSCPTPQLPACQTAGALSGECTQCSATNASVCTGLPKQPVCVAGKEQCGCAQDSDCGATSGIVCDPAQPPAGQCVPGFTGADGGEAGASSSGARDGGDEGGSSSSSGGGLDSGSGATIDAGSSGASMDAGVVDPPVSLEGGGCAAGGAPASSLVSWGALGAWALAAAARRRSRGAR